MQAIVPWSDEGGIARLTCNGVSLNTKGEWLLPYWREWGGPTVCMQEPSLHGTAGVLVTADQVIHPSFGYGGWIQGFPIGCASSAACAPAYCPTAVHRTLIYLPSEGNLTEMPWNITSP